MRAINAAHQNQEIFLPSSTRIENRKSIDKVLKSGLACFRWLTYIMDETKRKLFAHIFFNFFLESLKKLGFMRLAEEKFF